MKLPKIAKFEEKPKNPINLLSYPISLIRSIIKWFKAGEAPPETHRKSMMIMIGLLAFGIPIFTIFILALLKIKFYTYVKSYASFAFMSFITLCPGLYSLWITVCCWRRVKGYEWSMIPFFD